MKRILFILALITTAPIILLIVMIRPFIRIRFGTMVSKRIGHFAHDVEAYLCSKENDRTGNNNTFDIIGCPEPVCNRQLKKMWARTIRISPGARLWTFFDRACQFWTRGKEHHVQLYDRRKDYSLITTSRQHLSFTFEEHEQGKRLLKQMGIPIEAAWICIHNRDSTYLNKKFHGDWAYHDYRDFSITTLVAAAEELTNRGYYIVRVGSSVAEKLITKNKKIIDYSSSTLRSEFGDIYLSAECSAFISSDAGISCIPLIFHKPVSYINYSATLIDHFIDLKCSPFIVKRLWDKKKRRFMSMREIFNAGLAGASESWAFERLGVEPVCNTAEEICSLAIEVEERLNGRWFTKPEDEELQNRFWEICEQNLNHFRIGEIKTRIGSAFLRNHIDLLN